MRKEPNLDPSPPEPTGNVEIPLWAVWVVMVLFIPTTGYVVTTLHDVRDGIRQANYDKWRKSEMREWVHEFRDNNWESKFKTPDVDEISTRMNGAAQ